MSTLGFLSDELFPVISPADTKTGSEKNKATKHNKNKVNGKLKKKDSY